MLGPYYFRRAHRMSYNSFLHLHSLLRHGIDFASKEKREDIKARRPPTSRTYVSNSAPLTQNGIIDSSDRLAIALHYFAGGSMYELSPLYGVGFTDCKYSIWYVVQAINRLSAFAIKYPSDNEVQRQIARQFEVKSTVGFKGCAGAIDDVLIWIHRPYESDAQAALCNPGKFYCPRKHKYGLNCQAVSDSRGKILDLSIVFPGSTSDLLAFEGSGLYTRLQDEGFLADGLCLFGDNAYINTRYLATPFPGVASGLEDWYNFYHSQLRIRVECCFGVLVQRWGILRSAIPRRISLTKTSRLVLALAKLHNFCIDQNDAVTAAWNRDEMHIRTAEGRSLHVHRPSSNTEYVPTEIIGGGDHIEDHSAAWRRRNSNYEARDELVKIVKDSGLRRPVPRPRRH